MTRLNVLAPTRYPSQFNSARASRHNIVRRNFLPFNYVHPSLEGVTVFAPSMPRKIDIIHAFNRIPLNRHPFLIGFESHLPRGFGVETSTFFSFMRAQLTSERCRAIVAISEYAKRTFLSQHRESSQLRILEDKLLVRLPSVIVPGDVSPTMKPLQPIRLFFVGNHFARKGGCVALRLAERAQQAGVPVSVEIVSSLEVGKMSWTDPLDAAFFDRYRPLLELPNVKVWGSLPNRTVLEKLRKAHFLLLPTFGDSFGYSAVEALANGTPVIATNQCALPEFIEDGHNGFLLDLPTNHKGEWVHLNSPERGTRWFERIHAEEVDRLADEILHRLVHLLEEPHVFAEMASHAYATALARFDSRLHDPFWDKLYEVALTLPVSLGSPSAPTENEPYEEPAQGEAGAFGQSVRP